MTDPASNGTESTRRLFALEPLGLGQIVQIAAFVGVLLGSLRLLGSAHGDVSTALVLLSYGGYTRPIIALLLTTIPAIVLYSVITIQIYRFAHKEAKLAFRFESQMHYVLYIVAMFGFFTIDGIVFLSYAVIYSFATIFERTFVRKKERKSGTAVTPTEYVSTKRQSALGAFGSMVVFVVVLNIIASQGDLFGPREKIEVSSVSYYGSLVGDRDGWDAILADQGRLLYVKDGEIQARAVCRETDFQPLSFWLAGRITRKTSDVRCPEPKN